MTDLNKFKMEKYLHEHGISTDRGVMQILEEKESEPWLCGRCHKWFVTFRTNISCTVMHGFGDCCHYNDREVNRSEVSPRSEAVEAIADTLYRRVYADLPASVKDAAERVMDVLQEKGWHYG